MSSSPKGCSTRPSSASAATGRNSRTGRTFVSRAAQQPGGGRKVLRRSGRKLIREAARLYATGGNGAIYYGLGVTEHSQGSTTVMAIANLAMADRQHRPARRRREPAARPEQRAGRLRHGLVPARTAGLPPRLRRRDARHLREALGRDASTTSRACASPTCWTPPSKARSRASTSRARTSCSPTPTPSMSRRALPRWNAWSCRTSSSTRPRTTRMSSCRARPSSKRTAPSPMPSGASTACAR